MKRFIVNCTTLVRFPIIILLILPTFSLGWDSPELMFWLYIGGLLSHGLDGVLAERLIPKYENREKWHILDTRVFSLGLQLAAVTVLFHELGTKPLTAILLVALYVTITGLIQGFYIDPRVRHREKFIPVILMGSGVVWLALGGSLAYQAYETENSVWFALEGIIAYGLCHVFLHKRVWSTWLNEAEGKEPVRT